jgi:hypothetical protein
LEDEELEEDEELLLEEEEEDEPKAADAEDEVDEEVDEEELDEEDLDEEELEEEELDKEDARPWPRDVMKEPGRVCLRSVERTWALRASISFLYSCSRAAMSLPCDTLLSSET